MESCIGINETKAKDRSFEPEVIMSAIQSFPRIFNGISLKIIFCYPKVVSNRGIFENLSNFNPRLDRDELGFKKGTRDTRIEPDRSRIGIQFNPLIGIVDRIPCKLKSPFPSRPREIFKFGLSDPTFSRAFKGSLKTD